MNQPRDWTSLQRLLALLGLTGLAITQPLLAFFSGTPVLFVFNRVHGFTIVAIAVAIALVPPLMLWGIDRIVARFDEKASTWVHLATVWLLTVLFVIPMLKFSFGLTQPFIVGIVAVIAALVITWGYRASEQLAKVIQIIAVLPALAVGLFLFASESSDLVKNQPEVAPVQAVAGGATDTPVVVLMLDELPTKSILDSDGSIDAERLPNFAAFAQDATWYRHFTTKATLTHRAAPSLLAGRDGVGTAIWNDYPESLFTALASTHDMSVDESVTRLCGLDVCAGDPEYGRFWSQVSQTYFQRIGLSTPGRSFADFEEPTIEVEADTNRYTDDLVVVPERFDSFLRAIEPGEIGSTERPDFFYLHLLMPHQPWNHFEDGELYYTAETDLSFPSISRWNSDGPWVAALTEQRHHIQLAYTDRLIGEFIDELKRAEIYDDALVVVVSDHGSSFEENTQIRTVTDETFDSLAYSPLFIKYPQQTQGQIDDSNVMATDLLPTIASVVDVPVPAGVTGDVIGSSTQVARDGTKTILDVPDDGVFAVRGTLTFQDEEHFPDATDRWIPPDAGDDPLAVIAGIDDLIGTRIDELVSDNPEPGGTVTVDNLADHEQPGEVPHALVVGRTAVATTGVIAIAVDGTIVTGSPIYDFAGSSGTFAALLPQELIDQAKTLRVILLDGDGTTELTIER